MRRIWTSTELKDYVKFPHVKQVFCIERVVWNLKGQELRKEVCYGLASLSPKQARPKELLGFNRNHWAIENRLHWVRDVTFDEDRSRIRSGNGAQVMASLRNVAIGLVRLAGGKNIARALRDCAWNAGRALRLIGL